MWTHIQIERFERCGKYCFGALAAVLVQLLSLPWSAYAELETENNSLTRQFDWVLYVDGDSFENFLNYPGSGLVSMNKFRASYMQTGSSFYLRNLELPVYQGKHYEEFWYHDGRPIGQRRSCSAPQPADEQGAIILRPQRFGERFSHSAANCLIRLFLETRLNRSIVAAIVVPQDLFEKMTTDFGQFNFLPVQSDTKAADGNLTFRLLSEPPGFERHFYFVDRHSSN